MVGEREVTERKYMLSAIEGQTAGLGALATVTAPAAYHRGKYALSRVADAERTVEEHLNLRGGVFHRTFYVFKAALTGKDHTADAHFVGGNNAVGGVNRHLG